MTIDLMKYLINKYDGSCEGRKYGVSNQVVGRYICVTEIDNYVINFLKNINASIVAISKNQMVVKIKDETYKVIVIKENCKGRRFYKAYLDNRLSDEIIEQLILPYMSFYCKEVKIF